MPHSDMRFRTAPALPVLQHRRAQRLAVWNAALWAVGNGLASTTLVVYLARELHAERLGLGIGLIVAAPQIVGLLRLGAPALIERLGGRKPFCLTAFLLSALLLLTLPWVCAGPAPFAQLVAGGIILLWCLYHLFQYLATVGLWSWLADLAPERVRGRFLGRRQRWFMAGEAAAALAAGLFVWKLQQMQPGLPKWLPYGISAGLGAGLMIAALVPLALMPAAGRGSAGRHEGAWRAS